MHVEGVRRSGAADGLRRGFPFASSGAIGAGSQGGRGTSAVNASLLDRLEARASGADSKGGTAGSALRAVA
jgi:hypothetical protein